MICIYIFIIFIILYIMFNITNKKINEINGGYIENAEDGHTYISTVNSNKNVNINGNEINLESKKICFNDICLTNDDFKNIKKINNINNILNKKQVILNYNYNAKKNGIQKNMVNLQVRTNQVGQKITALGRSKGPGQGVIKISNNKRLIILLFILFI